jgi:predicted aspartyl protease
MTIDIYQLQRHYRLMTLKAFVADSEGIYRGIRLLVDTGATYTVLPIKFLIELGYDVSASARRTKISAAGGMLEVPMINVDRFSCLGRQVDSFSVVGLDLPFSTVVNGLLGMDFLERHRALIDTGKAEILIPSI